ncbi:MAG TPA: alpha/beta fold hydrolase, partial [Acidobacteriota bacterium]|nr:alpha/beta fold hydrolase [Acidobacteriota bacterium]
MNKSPVDLLRMGSGPPLVLIGGLHGHFEFQRPIAEKLAPDFQVFCFSLPGEERLAESPETVREVAHCLLAQASSQELGRYFLCGISTGGIIALEMALQAPQRIARIASVVSFAEYNFLHPQLKRLFDFLLARGLEKTCRRLSRSTLLALTIRELWVERAHTSVMRAYWKCFQK